MMTSVPQPKEDTGRCAPVPGAGGWLENVDPLAAELQRAGAWHGAGPE